MDTGLPSNAMREAIDNLIRLIEDEGLPGSSHSAVAVETLTTNARAIAYLVHEQETGRSVAGSPMTASHPRGAEPVVPITDTLQDVLPPSETGPVDSSSDDAAQQGGDTYDDTEVVPIEVADQVPSTEALKPHTQDTRHNGESDDPPTGGDVVAAEDMRAEDDAVRADDGVPVEDDDMRAEEPPRVEKNQGPSSPHQSEAAETQAVETQGQDGPDAPGPPQPGGIPPFPSQKPNDDSVRPIETLKKSVFLLNARVNEPYDSPLTGMDDLRSAQMADEGGSGLQFDEATLRLNGTPTESGDFRIVIRGLLSGRPAEITANLAVIPDPKSLWVSLPSDPDATFWKQDEDFGEIHGDLLCVAASKRGRSHAREGGCRDDDFGLHVTGPGGWHVATVADGAGSAKYSRRGSRVAVRKVLSELPPLLDEHLASDLDELVGAYMDGGQDAEMQIKGRLYQTLATTAFNAAKAVEEEASSHGEVPGAFSTTLIICVARRTANAWFFAGFSIGDGGAAVFDLADGTLTKLTLPDSGEFAGQTRFLQRSEFAGGFEEVSKRIFFDVRERFTALALMTDGITDPKFPTEAVFANPDEWAKFWADLSSAVLFADKNLDRERQFMDWMDFWSPGNHDDRTLAVLVPVDECR